MLWTVFFFQFCSPDVEVNIRSPRALPFFQISCFCLKVLNLGHSVPNCGFSFSPFSTRQKGQRPGEPVFSQGDGGGRGSFFARFFFGGTHSVSLFPPILPRSLGACPFSPCEFRWWRGWVLTLLRFFPFLSSSSLPFVLAFGRPLVSVWLQAGFFTFEACPFTAGRPILAISSFFFSQGDGLGPSWLASSPLQRFFSGRSRPV